MELDADSVINLILQIRDPQTVNEATNHILQFLRIPQSINILFQIISNPENIEYVDQFTILSISQYCEINREFINQDLLNFIRSNLLQILIGIKKESYLPILLRTISVVINLFPSNWPEIQEYAFSAFDPSTIIIRVELLSMLITYLPEETVLNQLGVFIQLLQAVYQSDNMNLQCTSVFLAVKIVEKTQNIQLVSQLRPYISNLLKNVILNSDYDSNLLNQILNPIDEVKSLDFDLIDVNFVIDLTINSISAKEMPLYFKIQINNLTSLCLRHLECAIPYDKLRHILINEFSLSIQLYANEKEDQTNSWIYEVGNVIDCIFYRMTSQQVIQNVKSNFYAYYQNPIEGIRFFQLILLHELIMTELPNIENLLIELFPHVLCLLEDPSPRVRNFSAVVLGHISPFIKSHIIDELVDILEIVNRFILINKSESGTFLLKSVINCSNNTDEFIEYEYKFVKEILTSSNLFLCQDSMDILTVLFEKSKLRFVTIDEDAYILSAKLIKEDPSRYSPLLIFLSNILSKDKRLQNSIPEFISLLISGLNSQDYEIINNSLYAIQFYFNNYPKDEQGSELSIQLSKELFPSLKMIFELPNDDNFTYSLKGSSILSIVSFLNATKVDNNLLNFFFQCVNNFLSIDNDIMGYSLVKSNLLLFALASNNDELSDLIVNNECIQNIVKALILKIITIFKGRVSIEKFLIGFISEAITKFGFQKIQINPNEIAQYILDRLKYYTNFNTSDKKTIKAISQAIATIIIYNPDREPNSQIIKVFMPYLENLLNDQLNPSHQVIAVNSFTFILSNASSLSLFDQSFFDQLIQKMISFISDINYKLVKSACKFLISVLKIAKDRIIPVTQLILSSLFERFKSIQDRQYQSVSLSEILMITISHFQKIFVDSIPADQFLRELLSVLPLTNKVKYADFIYSITNSLQLFVKDNPDLCKGLYRVYVLVISDRNRESLFISRYLLGLLAYFISQNDGLFSCNEEKIQFIAQIFGNDELAYQNFNIMYPIYLEEGTLLANPPVNDGDNQIIDLTGEQYDFS